MPEYLVTGTMDMFWTTVVKADSKEEAMKLGTEEASDGNIEFTGPVSAAEPISALPWSGS